MSALLLVLEVVPHIPVVVAGDGPLADGLRRGAPLSVTFVGRLDRGQLVECRRRSLATLQPSRSLETGVLVAIESLAAGRAVIASRIGGLPEIVEDGVSGVLVEPGDPVALAGVMAALWADRARAEVLGARGRRIAEERFDLERRTDRLVAVYDEAMGIS